MQDTEAQELLLKILNNAKEGKSIQFHSIVSFAEFRFFWRNFHATKLIIRTLKEASNNIFKTYCKEVSTRSSDINKLLAFSRLRDVITFYNKDLDTLKRMLDEYDDYLGNGHFWYSILGGKRNL